MSRKDAPRTSRTRWTTAGRARIRRPASVSVPAQESGERVRVRSETFADHFSQARQFFISQTEPEQNHIVAALIFELSKVETKAIRMRMLGQLANIDARLAERVAGGLGLDAAVKATAAARPTRTDLPPSPALSILGKVKPTLKGRVVGCLVADGSDAAVVKELAAAVAEAGGMLKSRWRRRSAATIEADFQLAGGPSVLFDAVVLALAADAAAMLAKEAAAVGVRA